MNRITRALAVLSVLFAAGASMHAQNPPRDPVPTTPLRGTAMVSGLVVDADNKPMRQVTVRLDGDVRASRAVITGADGRFEFADVASGEFALRASKPGFPDTTYGAKRPGRPGARIQIKDGEKVQGATLRMERGAVLTGTVYDDRGQPLPGASVTAYQTFTALDGALTFRSVVSSGSAFPVTDDRGVFRFYGLPAGEYVVGLSPFFRGLGESASVPTDEEIRDALRATRAAGPSAPPKPAADPRPSMNFVPVYYPNALNPMDAVRVRLAPGEERAGLDLRAVLRPTAAITGNVVGFDGPGNQVENIMARRTAAHGLGSTLYGLAQPDLSFTLANLTPGDYTVIARTRTEPVRVASQDITVMTSDVRGVALTLAPPTNMDGQLVIDAAAPPASLSAFRAGVAPTSATANGPFPPAAAIAPDGSFKITGVFPGRVRVSASVPPGRTPSEPLWMLSSVMLGDRDITDLGVDVTSGAVYPKLTITVTDRISSLSGTILNADGSPANDVFVIAVAADQKYWMWSSRRIKSARPDANGKYLFAGLPPGVYRVAVTTDLESSDLQDRSFLEQIVAASAEVTIAPAE
jgi:hypothetical protein